jgi:spore coat polysaccharide biosynthesis protein SpsF
MGSTRFPGKMLAPLGGHALLEWVLRRVAQSRKIDAIVLATSTNSRDDALATLAGQLSTLVFRGDESDVLGRFIGAAAEHRADWVVRICADNPFIDPDEIDRLVQFFRENDCDYACNHLDRLGSRYADGFGSEILRTRLLQHIGTCATESRHREHVTLYLWDHASEFDLRAVPAPPALAHPELAFDVDEPADLARLEQLVARGINFQSPAAQIVNLEFGHGSQK